VIRINFNQIDVFLPAISFQTKHKKSQEENLIIIKSDNYRTFTTQTAPTLFWKCANSNRTFTISCLTYQCWIYLMLTWLCLK